jgi:hypothetical protein
MRTKPFVCAVGLLLLAVFGFGACGGGDDRFSSLELTLRPADLPGDTFRLTVYILPSIVSIGGSDEAIACDLFVGPKADKQIYDYSDHLVSAPTSVPINPLEETAVSLKGLPEGLLVFVIEALDESSNLLAMGCGKGQISRGEKTFIPIFMEDR